MQKLWLPIWITKIGLLVIFTSACTTQVAVVDKVPGDCEYVKQVDVAMPEGEDTYSYQESLRIKARSLKADTLECCWQGAFGHFSGRSSKGYLTGFYGTILSGKTYRCSAKLKQKYSE